MANKIEEINTTFISLVKKGANRTPIQIFKSADHIDPEESDTGSGSDLMEKAETNLSVDPAETSTMEEPTADGLIKLLKGFFGIGKKPIGGKEGQDCSIKKGYIYTVTSFTERINSFTAKLWRAIQVLESTIYDIYYSDEDNKLALINENIKQFNEYMVEAAKTVGITKADINEDMDSIPRDAIKAHIDGFSDLITKYSSPENINMKEEEAVELTKEDIKAMLAPISKGIEDLTSRIEKIEGSPVKPAEGKEHDTDGNKQDSDTSGLEKSTESNVDPKVDPVAELKTTLETGISSIQKSIDAINNRVQVIEDARGGSAAGADREKPVEKEDPWAGVLPVFDNI